MLSAKMTIGYCDWINEISGRYPLQLVQYANHDGNRIIAKLNPPSGVVLIGVFTASEDTGKILDRRGNKR